MAPQPPAAADILADLLALGGAGLEIVELPGAAAAPLAADLPGVVRVGVHREGPLPAVDADAFDVLLSVHPGAPAPWVGLAPPGLDPAVATLQAAADRQPVAAAVAAQVLRMTLALPFEQALTLESLAYSALLASAGFRAWRAAHPPRPRPDDGRPRIRLDEAAGVLALRLARPEARNAFDARLRDELVEALAFALDHPDAPPVELSGEGPAFSAGGDLDEFGQAPDVGVAHLIRTLRAPARLARRLGPRLTVRVHGACIGAGIEVPAAAQRVVAARDAVFRLPEVGMGLIPGAGGMASLPQRIGRHRTAWLALSGAPLDAPTALAWGLVDAIDPPP